MVQPAFPAKYYGRKASNAAVAAKECKSRVLQLSTMAKSRPALMEQGRAISSSSLAGKSYSLAASDIKVRRTKARTIAGIGRCPLGMIAIDGEFVLALPVGWSQNILQCPWRQRTSGIELG
ncbi:hypothetical protein [Rhizobium lusitanum]|uniref:Uncharacterized protein n=1 Tax=Rhizobium lusitanum TaxID=293958 RepID=A0A7X0ME00_9HYPH|nr:hypothetical protein [Rhizobium lusitanum]MBB6486966.1 hypothetical protein [Rhizobium lusitanum]